jgi:hypothetical protein
VTKLIGIIGVQLASIASIIRFYYSLPQSSQGELQWQLFAAGICLFNVGAVVWEVVSHFQTAPKRFRLTQPEKIRRYMIKWLRSGGRCVIFTRDMTWVDATVQQILTAKAKRHELTICIEHPLLIADALRAEGAEIISYGELGVVPKSHDTPSLTSKSTVRV